MRAILLICFCLLLPGFLFAQAHSFTYIGAGITGSAVRLQGLNAVIDRYNETRQGQQGAASLSQDMGYFNAQSGYEFSLGRSFDDLGWFFDLHLSFQEAATFAEGVDLFGNPARRDLRLKSSIFSAGTGPTLIQTGMLDVAAGMAVEITWNKMYSILNEGEESEIFEDEVPIAFTPFAFATLFLSRKIPLAVFGRAFLQLPLLASDYTELNQAINPATWQNDEGKDFSNMNWRPGFSLGIALIFHERDLSFHR